MHWRIPDIRLRGGEFPRIGPLYCRIRVDKSQDGQGVLLHRERYMGYMGCKTGIWQLLGHSLQRFPNLNSLCRGSGIYGLECPAIDDTTHVCLYHLLANDSTTLEDRVEL